MIARTSRLARFMLIISVSILLLSPVCVAGKSVLIKIATLAPEGSSWMETFNTLKTEIMQKTEQNVQFRIYAGGVLGDEKDMLRKLHIGQIHGAVLTSSGLSALYGEIDVLQIPFLFQTYGEVDHVLDKMNTFFRKGFEDNGYVLLGWSEAGFVRLMSTTPVASLNDLKKMKVWTWEDAPLSRAIFDEAEVSAIPLTVPDVLVGLQTGLVDVVYAPPAGAISLQWFTRVKYLTDVPLTYLVGAVVIKKNVFSQIPPVYQSAISESFRLHLGKLKTIIRNENQEALRVMEKHGVKIIKPSQDAVEEFMKLSDKAVQRLGAVSFSPKTRDDVSAYLKEYRDNKK
ncbi:MAG: TRAP transporter substrate-binding protein DctP [Desulfobacterales bacterium]